MTTMRKASIPYTPSDQNALYVTIIPACAPLVSTLYTGFFWTSVANVGDHMPSDNHHKCRHCTSFNQRFLNSVGCFRLCSPYLTWFVFIPNVHVKTWLPVHFRAAVSGGKFPGFLQWIMSGGGSCQAYRGIRFDDWPSIMSCTIHLIWNRYRFSCQSVDFKHSIQPYHRKILFTDFFP